MTLAIVGAGRAGHGLARALRAARVKVIGPAGRVRRRSFSGASVILLCVPDGAIERAAGALAPDEVKGKVVLHVSGAAGVSVLSALRARGASVGSMHPLVVFPPVGARTPDLRGALFAVDGGAAARRTAFLLARRLGGSPIMVPEPRRAAYHLAASLVANGMVALFGAGVALASRRARLPKRAARRGLATLALTALEGLVHDAPARALTGPAARGDAATLRRHLQVLSALDPDLRRLYALLARRAVGMARSGGRLNARRAAALRRLLIV